MAANYNRLKPVDTVAYRAGRRLGVACQCGHRAQLLIGAVAAQYGLGRDVHLYELVERLVCSWCGRKDPSVQV